MVSEQQKEKIQRVKDLVAEKQITVSEACKQIGIGYSAFYNGQKEKKAAKPKAEVKKRSHKKQEFTPTQILVAKDKNVSIVIMKGDQDAVADIAKSLSWMGDLQ